jgi:hypothetical protein
MKMRPRPRLLQATIEIINPPPETSAGPCSYPISDPNGCKIAANGHVTDPHATQITSVLGSVNGGPAVAGTASGLDWAVTVGPAISGTKNTFSVDVTCDTQSGASVTAPQDRDFIATGFGGSCGPSGMRLPGKCRPIAAIMPRYYKLTVDVRALPQPAQGEPLLLGGLLARAPAYLGYDLDLSTPDEPVWRDLNLPASSGSWTLRVRACGGRLTGELVLQRLTETKVFPPLVLRCASWTFTGYNFLTVDPAAGAGPGALAVAVMAEPA